MQPPSSLISAEVSGNVGSNVLLTEPSLSGIYQEFGDLMKSELQSRKQSTAAV